MANQVVGNRKRVPMPMPLATELVEAGQLYANRVGKIIKSNQSLKNPPTLTVHREWVLVKLGPDDRTRESNAIDLFGILNVRGAPPELAWSCLAFLLDLKRGDLVDEAYKEGWTVVEKDFDKLDPKPDAQWAEENFVDPTQLNETGATLTIIGSLLGIMLGKVINQDNYSYLQSRTKKLSEMSQFPLKRNDWYANGPVVDNLIEMTSRMNQTPYIRSVFFNRLLMKVRTDKTPLIKLWEYTVQMLDGAYMTPQISILRELAPRAHILLVFPDIKEELSRFMYWYKKLTNSEQQSVGYLRLIYGMDKTAPVSINRVPLCTSVASLLLRSRYSSFANYAAPERLDDKIQSRAKDIYERIIRLDTYSPETRDHLESLGITPEELSDLFKELDGRTSNDLGVGVDFQITRD
ncbi:MAG: hypothetical protein [brine shrimp arlivirus 2]|nr:MAG: hypothetical protein [brine shrimp arlivirus 2]